MPKTTWAKETPTEEGWYWIKYRRANHTRTCPCWVTRLKDGTAHVKTAGHLSFIEGPNHGGPGLKVAGETKVQKSIRFGPPIPVPD